jgi:hypothetical protein
MVGFMTSGLPCSTIVSSVLSLQASFVNIEKILGSFSASDQESDKVEKTMYQSLRDIEARLVSCESGDINQSKVNKILHIDAIECGGDIKSTGKSECNMLSCASIYYAQPPSNVVIRTSQILDGTTSVVVVHNSSLDTDLSLCLPDSTLHIGLDLRICVQNDSQQVCVTNIADTDEIIGCKKMKIGLNMLLSGGDGHWYIC